MRPAIPGLASRCQTRALSAPIDIPIRRRGSGAIAGLAAADAGPNCRDAKQRARRAVKLPSAVDLYPQEL